jgi:hypothetical protein
MGRTTATVRLASVLTATLAIMCPSVAASAAPTTTAAVPHFAQLALTQVTPTSVGRGGQFILNVTLTKTEGSVCSFDLYQFTPPTGWVYLGRFPGTRFRDETDPARGTLQYSAVPYGCDGTSGERKDSELVQPLTLYDPFTLVSGAAHKVQENKALGGQLLRTTAPGTRVRVRTPAAFNNGIVIQQSPEGGIGTVYVDGVQAGTIKFYAPKVKLRQLRFTFGASVSQARTIEIVQTGTGGGGGIQMDLDGLTNLTQ